MNHPDEILVTTHDFRDLQRAIARELDAGRIFSLPLLVNRLSRARTVPPEQVPADCITMHSLARYFDEHSATLQECILVYPGHQRASSKMVSVTSELGAVLLGLREGRRARWEGVRGNRTVRLVRVLHQPERHAAGEERALPP
jgi:regulator of nucleoside diphosphate kinase